MITPVNQSFTYNDSVGNLQEAIGLTEVAEGTQGAIGVRLVDASDPDGNITEAPVSFWAESDPYIGVSGNPLDAQPAFIVDGDTYVDGSGQTVASFRVVSAANIPSGFQSLSAKNNSLEYIDIRFKNDDDGYGNLFGKVA